MKLYYSFSRVQNFGDDINLWIFGRLLGDILDEDMSELLLGIGTILNHRVARAPMKNVFGSGFGYGYPPDLRDGRWRFYAVRGPRTAQALGLAPQLAICDPAILVSNLMTARPVKRYRFSFMPHFESMRCGLWRQAAELAGANFVNPSAPVHDTLDQIAASEVLISEAMHGAIVADALGTPWHAVEPVVPKHRAKWSDWSESLDISVRFNSLGPSSFAERRNAQVQAFKGAIKNIMLRSHLTRQLLDKTPQTEAAEFLPASAARAPISLATPPAKRNPEPRDHPLLERAARALTQVKANEPQLSSRCHLNRAIERLNEAAERLRREYLERLSMSGH
jgi:hypothetical protein